ncbi:MAG: transglutaminase-like domain-containing protein [Thermofilaceae archaeon]
MRTSRVVRLILVLAPLVLSATSCLISSQASRGASIIPTAVVTYTIDASFLLANRYNFTVRDPVYIPLPQNTSFQQSFVVSIDPPPLRYVRDEDGNVYAIVEVEVPAQSKIWISARYKVIVTAYRLEGEVYTWPPLEVVRRYTSSSGYWDIYNETLIELAYRVGFAHWPTEVARRLAEWVVRRVNYRVQLSRLGSNHAVVRGFFDYAIVGDCVEVADVYVTLARILGLPARTAFGLLLTDISGRMWLNLSTIAQEGEALLEHWGGHMWPQIYLPGLGWVDVDMLDGMKPNVGVYSERHIVFGFEETKYYGSALGSAPIPSYLRLEYVEYVYRGERS